MLSETDGGFAVYHRLLPTPPERLLARRFRIAALKMRAATAGISEAKFNPNQPRVPAGNPDGGRWTDAGGGSSRAAGGLPVVAPAANE